MERKGKSLGMAIKNMDEYCRMHNRILSTKKFPIMRQGKVVGQIVRRVVDNSEEYYVGK